MSELQRLRDRVEELEELAGMGDDDVALIKLVTGLEPDCCKMLGIIRRRRGLVSQATLYGYIYGDKPECDQPGPKVIDVQLCKVRKALRPFGLEITTVRSMGYTMADEHRAQLKAMMEAKLGAADQVAA